LFCAGVIVLAGVAAYHNSFSGALVFDDHHSILENRTIRELWPPWALWSPPKQALVGGRPLANFTFALNYAASGLNVWSYHALNLAIHLLAAFTLLGVVRRTLLQPVLLRRFGGAATELALAVAVLWTVHPLQTQVVDYVSQRTEALMGLCYLLTLYGLIRGTEIKSDSVSCGRGALIPQSEACAVRAPRPHPDPTPQRWLAFSFAACLFGLASKEVIVTAPLMVFLYDRTFIAGTFREAWRQRGRFHLALMATWIVLPFFMFGAENRGVGYGLGVSWLDYAVTECKVVVLYLQLALWPHPLVFDYGSHLVHQAAEVVPYALVLGPLLAGTLAALRWRPVLGFAGGWVFVILASRFQCRARGGTAHGRESHVSVAGRDHCPRRSRTAFARRTPWPGPLAGPGGRPESPHRSAQCRLPHRGITLGRHRRQAAPEWPRPH